jgi:cold shock CspA family protein
MRFKGTIAEWNDDRGFGFIKPADGGDRGFCHIKAFQERSQRPSLNATVPCELPRDAIISKAA